MSNIEYKKQHIDSTQRESIHKTREIIRMLDESQSAGEKSLTMLNEQYEKLERANNIVDSTNHNLEVSSDILGRIKHFFFPRRACTIDKIPKNISAINNNNLQDLPEIDNHDNHDNHKHIRSKSCSIKSIKSIKSEFVNQDLEEEIDNNLDEINRGVSNLKNIALTMNSQLKADAELLDRVSTKAEIVNKNIKKINKEIIKVL